MEEIDKILREWDESRGFSSHKGKDRKRRERIKRAGKSLSVLLDVESFKPWKRSAPKGARRRRFLL